MIQPEKENSFITQMLMSCNKFFSSCFPPPFVPGFWFKGFIKLADFFGIFNYLNFFRQNLYFSGFTVNSWYIKWHILCKILWFTLLRGIYFNKTNLRMQVKEKKTGLNFLKITLYNSSIDPWDLLLKFITQKDVFLRPFLCNFLLYSSPFYRVSPLNHYNFFTLACFAPVRFLKRRNVLTWKLCHDSCQ